MSAITPDKSFSSDLVLSIVDYFHQVRRALDQGSSGPEAFQLLLRHLADHFDSGDKPRSIFAVAKFWGLQWDFVCGLLAGFSSVGLFGRLD